MRPELLYATVLWMSWLGCISPELTPGEQAKVSVTIQLAQTTLQIISDENKAAAEALKNAQQVSHTMKSAEIQAKQQKLSKIGSKVGKALRAVQAASAIASFVFTFFIPSQLEVITDLMTAHFKQVNAKLDRIETKLGEMEKSIKANTAFNVFLSKWIEWEYKSRNGAKKLSDIRKAMGIQPAKRIDQVKLAEEYINYYENNDLDGNLLNLTCTEWQLCRRV